MKVNSIEVTNVNVAYSELWPKIKVFGVREKSRGGDVLVFPGPYLTTYLLPRERVLFDPDRDANPVFHLMEAIWMFAGRDDVDFLLPFNARYSEYAETNGRVWGAYGRRWRLSFGQDQIRAVVNVLRQSPETRQAVIQMWDADLDLGNVVRDRPCNTHIYFDRRDEALNMTVCCRSNDMVWGAYGANVVHFSMLQELIAHAVKEEVGTYTQMSNNAHVYLDVPIVKKHLASPPSRYDYYVGGEIVAVPMLRVGDTYTDFLLECELFCAEPSYIPHNHFLVMAKELRSAYLERKRGNPRWRAFIPHNDHIDWVRAFIDWTGRR